MRPPETTPEHGDPIPNLGTWIAIGCVLFAIIDFGLLCSDSAPNMGIWETDMVAALSATGIVLLIAGLCAFLFSNWSHNVVSDPSAPELYSKRAICGFSFWMSPLFGAILMSMNLRRIGKARLAVPVIMFGIIWYALWYALPPLRVFHPSQLVLLWSLLGAWCMHHIFWRKFIGPNFKYRRRRTLIPVIISLAIMAAFVGLLWCEWFLWHNPNLHP
jgi:hypothetical protein